MSTPSGAAAAAPTSAATDARALRCRTTVWYVILASSFGLYVAGVIVLLLVKLRRMMNKGGTEYSPVTAQQQQQQQQQQQMRPWSRMVLKCQSLIKGSNTGGKIMLAIYSIFVVGSFFVYVLLTYQFTDMHKDDSRKTLLICYTPEQFPAIHIDMAMNIYYLIIFIIRLLASDSLLSFWLSLDTFADHLTIVPGFIMYCTGDYMIAFQYARLVGLRFFVNTLIYCNIMKAEKHIRLLTLLFRIFVIWAVSAGFFQLLEVVGDFWSADPLRARSSFIQYHNCFYFILITMSTVGYGDYSPNSVLGKFFVVIFIVVALGIFTGIIPEVSEILTENKKYRKNKIILKQGMRHVVIVGNFSRQLTQTLFADFFHEARAPGQRDFIALLGDEEPSLELRALLKTRDLYVTYLQGDVMSLKDMKRAEMQKAAAVILLADARSNKPEDEDMKNIMRVIAVKDFCPTVGLLVQLQLYRSKTYLRNIPDWSPAYGDQAVCINEIKQGLLAQSCIVPGISTLLCNLLMLRSVNMSGIIGLSKDNWLAQYMTGISYDFYIVPFAAKYSGSTFQQACYLCYEQCSVLLLAVEVSLEKDKSLDSQQTKDSKESSKQQKQVIINPGDQLIIEPTCMLAFVVAKDERHALMISSSDLLRRDELRQEQSQPPQPPHQKQQKRKKNSGADGEVTMLRYQHKQIDGQANHSAQAANAEDEKQSQQVRHHSSFGRTAYGSGSGSGSSQQQAALGSHDEDDEEEVLDSSGYFHWTSNHPMQTILLDSHKQHRFRNHLVVCLLERQSPITVTSFLMPLRASSVHREQLKDIVFVGEAKLLADEWSNIQNFPRVFILNGSPLSRANLKSVSIEYSDCCLIMSPTTVSQEQGAQSDRDSVLCTLNIKTMLHPETGLRLGDTVHIITELNSEESIAYLDQDDDIEVDEPYMTQAFATGRTFYQSLLDSIVTTIYFNQAALGFLRTVVTTVDCDEFEVDLNEQGFHFISPNSAAGSARKMLSRSASSVSHVHWHSTRQTRSHIQLLSLTKPPLADAFHKNCECQWRQFVLDVLQELHCICMGVSRLQVQQQQHETGVKNHRFVMTLPPDDTVLKESDLIFCLIAPDTRGVE